MPLKSYADAGDNPLLLHFAPTGGIAKPIANGQCLGWLQKIQIRDRLKYIKIPKYWPIDSINQRKPIASKIRAIAVTACNLLFASESDRSLNALL